MVGDEAAKEDREENVNVRSEGCQLYWTSGFCYDLDIPFRPHHHFYLIRVTCVDRLSPDDRLSSKSDMVDGRRHRLESCIEVWSFHYRHRAVFAWMIVVVEVQAYHRQNHHNQTW
jgi:hypothetical protein